jgi:hypothetical protein
MMRSGRPLFALLGSCPLVAATGRGTHREEEVYLPTTLDEVHRLPRRRGAGMALPPEECHLV